MVNSELVRLRRQLAQSDNDLNAARDECEQETRQLDLCKMDLGSLQMDLDRLNGEQGGVWQRLSNSPDGSPSEMVRSRPNVTNSTPSSRAVEKRMRSAEHRRHDELEPLRTELATLRVEHHRLFEEHRSANSRCADLEANNHELAAAREPLEADYRDQLEDEHAERQKLAEELKEFRANSEETARVAEQLISAALNLPVAPVATDEELVAARIKGVELRCGILAPEYLDRIMAEALESGGIHVSLPSAPRGSVPLQR